MDNAQLNREFRLYFGELYTRLSSEGCWTCPKDEWLPFVQTNIELGKIPAEAIEWPLLPSKD